MAGFMSDNIAGLAWSMLALTATFYLDGEIPHNVDHQRI